MDNLDQLLSQLSAINPYWAAGVAFFLALIRFGVIKLPFNIPLLSPSVPKAEAVKEAPVDEAGLRDRLQNKIAGRFDELIDEGYDEDDVYTFLVKQVRDYEPNEEENDAE